MVQTLRAETLKLTKRQRNTREGGYVAMFSGFRMARDGEDRVEQEGEREHEGRTRW